MKRDGLAESGGTLLIVDNYDSFTYNLVQQCMRLCLARGVEVIVRRNDAVTCEDVAALKPLAIVISPGPGGPRDAGISMQLVARFAGEIPIFGVCLGHQVIAQSMGARVGRAPLPMHGKVSEVLHGSAHIFRGAPHPMLVARYHSLAIERDSLPGELEVLAETADGVIMAIGHRTRPLWGVQFHPESFLTTGGDLLMSNFLEYALGSAARN